MELVPRGLPVLALMLALAVGVGPLLRRLPTPVLNAGDTDPGYAGLPTAKFVTAVTLLGGGCALVGDLLVPQPARTLWWVLASLGMLLAAIDLRTTWLPLPLTRIAWLATALAAGVALVTEPDSWLALAVRVVGGATAAWLLFGLVWLVSRGGFGFGDVRYAPVIGAAAAAVSATCLFWTLLLGPVIGAVVGLTRLMLRRSGPFPYAPAMLAGAYLALVLLSAMGLVSTPSSAWP